MRGATGRGSSNEWKLCVSIHAPHAGRDGDVELRAEELDVSIHAPHAGRDFQAGDRYIKITVSIHAPHAGRDFVMHTPRVTIRVSIHAPHAGRDMRYSHLLSPWMMFQSTRPMRGATTQEETQDARKLVSIHAPHAGRDPRLSGRRHRVQRFNPRAPCGARRRCCDRRGTA